MKNKRYIKLVNNYCGKFHNIEAKHIIRNQVDNESYWSAMII